jgi:hypothetical protein
MNHRGIFINMVFAVNCYVFLCPWDAPSLQSQICSRHFDNQRDKKDLVTALSNIVQNHAPSKWRPLVVWYQSNAHVPLVFSVATVLYYLFYVQQQSINHLIGYTHFSRQLFRGC